MIIVSVSSAALIIAWAVLAEFMPWVNLPPSQNAWFFCAVPVVLVYPFLQFHSSTNKIGFIALTQPGRFWNAFYFFAQPFAIFMEHYLWITSLNYTTAAMNTVVYLSYPTTVCIFSSVFLKKQYVWQVWACSGLSLIGVMFICFSTTQKVSPDEIVDATEERMNTWYGYVLCFTSSCFWSIYLVFAEGMDIAESGHGKIVDSLSGSFWQAAQVIGICIICPFALWLFGVEPGVPTITWIDITGGCLSSICFITGILIAQFGNSVIAAFVSALVIPATYFLDWLMGSLVITAGGIIGSLCIIFSFIFSTYYNIQSMISDEDAAEEVYDETTPLKVKR